MKKKFTRKKKKGVEEKEEIPILEPVEYPVKIYSTADKYKHYYSLWKVWHKEFLFSIGEGEQESRKRQLYLLDQVLANLEEMQKLVVEEKQKLLLGYLQRLRTIKKDLGSPVLSQNFYSIENSLRSLEKKIQDGYSFKNIQDSIKP